MQHRLFVVLVLILGSILPSGCSRTGRQNMGVITGKVIYQGVPLTGGAIHFFPDKDRSRGFAIRGDGTFVAEVPVGLARVAIETDSAKYKGNREEMMKKWRETAGPEYVHLKQEKLDSPPSSVPNAVYKQIPARFADPRKSGLTHEVVPGPQQRDFELQ
jgi:hypothetical protein